MTSFDTHHSVLLSPFDTLFFRDHRPFEAGQQKYCQNLFPTPLTFMGALGSAYLEMKNKSRQSLIQSFSTEHCDPYLGPFCHALDGTSSFRIVSLTVAHSHSNEILIPMPADLISKRYHSFKGGAEYHTKRLIPQDKGLMQPPETDYEYQEGYIPFKWFHKNEFKLPERMQRIFDSEKRTGIAIDPESFHAAEGALYFTNHYRTTDTKYNNNSFWVHYQTANKQELPLPQSFRLGGENRLVYHEDSSRVNALSSNLKRHLNSLRNKIQNDWDGKQLFRFAVYLLTPAIFINGSEPETWPWQGRAEFFAACVPRPVYVSGFKLTKNRNGVPRRLYRAVPAGAVYFFESSDESLKKELLNDYLFNKSISEVYPQAGFGTTLINSWEQ